MRNWRRTTERDYPSSWRAPGRNSPGRCADGHGREIGDGLRDPGKDRSEVEHEELGVEILLHGVGAEAGEVLDFEAAFSRL